MAKSSAGARIDALSSKQKRKVRTATKESRAWINVNLETIRSGSPSQVRNVLDELKDEGHITEEELIQEPDINQEDLLENNSEIEIVDEDTFEYDRWENRRQQNYYGEITLKPRYQEESDSNLDSDYYVLDVENDKCTFVIPDWYGGFRGVTPVGVKVINEIDCRHEVFEAIEGWIENDRTDYILNNLWINLGPKDYEEVKSKRVTVVQESFLEFLKKDKNIAGLDKSKFSRYLNNSRIVWHNGGMPLKELFSKEARMGWVAKSIKLFMENAGFSKHGNKIHQYNTIIIPKDKMDRLQFLNDSIDTMDLGRFIIYANISALTSWQEVYEKYFKAK